ncbi:AAA family ATPase [Hymenobacter oligotrophus]|uniref:AAA family ATPase n=1 Tax=Hymenobacter oligotrophus TaxID=2319843 RepID=UPI001F089CA6|nr:AAA family ATPase [Hymenobacter oligotrophus]
MTKTIFIASAEPYSGKSLVALGLVNMLLSKAQKVGYFKPVINTGPDNRHDAHIDRYCATFSCP